MSSVEAKLIYQKYDEMVELLRSYRERIYQQWAAGVDQDCRFTLGQPLVQRDPATSLVHVNFSKAVGVVWPQHREGSWARGCPGDLGFPTGQAHVTLRLTPPSYQQHGLVGLMFMSYLAKALLFKCCLKNAQDIFKI